MTIENNKKLYWQWFAAFGIAIITACLAVLALLPFTNKMTEEYQNLFCNAITLAPLIAIAMYGLYMNYFPGYWYNEILHGTSARIWNGILIVIYAAALMYDQVTLSK
jgi:hypothetical protein